MYNPFELFKAGMASEFLKRGRRWLVAQTCDAAVEEAAALGKKAILLTAYNEQTEADEHYQHAIGDPFVFMYDLEDNKQLNEVLQIVQTHTGYLFYTSLIKHRWPLEEKANRLFTESVRRFLSSNTNWNIGRDKLIQPVIRVKFGELYVYIKYDRKIIKVKLADLEKNQAYVL